MGKHACIEYHSYLKSSFSSFFVYYLTRKEKSSNETDDIQGFNRIESAKNKKSELPSPPKSVEPEMLRDVALSRPITKNFLTGSAAVVYGLPLRVLDF